MKVLVYLLTMGVLTLPTLPRATGSEMRADIDKDIPLAEAVRRANEELFPDGQPLTEDEVVAAVRAIKLKHRDISDAAYEIYQRVVRERVLPKGMYFSRIPGWSTEYGRFKVDWRDLTLDCGRAGIKGESAGSGFNYRIRARFISSEPLSIAEAVAMEERFSKREPLKGKPLPDLTSVGLAADAVPPDQPLLLCLLDAEQRPSRHIAHRLAEQHDTLKQKGVSVAVIQVRTGTSTATFQEWTTSAAMPFPVGCVTDKSADNKWATSVTSLPCLILRDAKGTVAAEGFALDELDAKIEGLKK